MSEERSMQQQSCNDLIDQMIALRKARRLTQKQLAVLCGMPQSFIGRMESKQRYPTLTTMLRVLDPLGATLTVTVKPQTKERPL